MVDVARDRFPVYPYAFSSGARFWNVPKVYGPFSGVLIPLYLKNGEDLGKVRFLLGGGGGGEVGGGPGYFRFFLRKKS